MRLGNKIVRAGTAAIVVLATVAANIGGVQADGVPQLVISQFKITSSAGQFVTLYNQSSTTLDLSQFEVDYINSSGKLASIPVTGQLASHAFYMLSDDQVRLCFQLTVDATSLGFATTSGTLQIWQVSSDKTSKQLQDAVTWASKATTGAVTLPTQNASNTVSLLRQPVDAVGNPQVASATGGSWQAVMPDAANPCNLDIVSTTTPVASPSSNPGNQLGAGQEPPATIVSLDDGNEATAAAPQLPAADIGLNAPQITELLPNPNGTGTDDTDEFIELYNANQVPFDLSGFTLETGTSTKHTYVFPDGTTLPANGFSAFYSADTGLSLSNSSGAADLLDPFGNQIAQSGTYSTAKDGVAWALAKGKWYWTAAVTPGTPNVIKQVATVKTASAKKKTVAVKGAATTTGASGGSAAGTNSASGDADATTTVPTHWYVLAGIAAVAVGYGVYEYRHDLANRIRQLRTDRAAG